jgi:hypothetical protein
VNGVSFISIIFSYFFHYINTWNLFTNSTSFSGPPQSLNKMRIYFSKVFWGLGDSSVHVMHWLSISGCFILVVSPCILASTVTAVWRESLNAKHCQLNTSISKWYVLILSTFYSLMQVTSYDHIIASVSNSFMSSEVEGIWVLMNYGCTYHRCTLVFLEQCVA